MSGNVAWCALCLLTQPPLVGALPPPVSSFPGLSLSPSLLPRRNSSPPALPAAGQGLGCWALTIPWCCRGNHRPFLGCSPVLPPGFCAGRPSATSLRPSIQRTFLPAACCRLCGLFRVFAFALRRVGSPFGPPPRLVPVPVSNEFGINSVECVSVRVWKVPRLPSRQKYAKHASQLVSNQVWKVPRLPSRQKYAKHASQLVSNHSPAPNSAHPAPNSAQFRPFSAPWLTNFFYLCRGRGRLGL